MLKKKIIMAFVSMMLDIPIREIRSESQKQHLVEARVIFVYICYKRGMKPAEIMNYLNRDRTTFYNCIENFRNWKTDPKFKQCLGKFDRNLY